ncbi:hypothetical protein [Pseudomonas citronellolis]|uniref:hypothetical protein n=1 Tax=Pseudomonas citronellolis TaxID=53408 RepID=UPI0023E3B46B|nr:hypothetical protein [Pseudomonas citronellolis]MDF3932769.1 hypothetical protein [Pseudomonas citronellolis]
MPKLIWPRRMLLRATEWLESAMRWHPDYDRNDPEWNELQNEVTALKRDLRQKGGQDGRDHQ